MISDDMEKVKNDIFYACESGKTIFFKDASEKLATLRFNAFPIYYKPFAPMIREKISCSDKCDVLAYLSSKSVNNTIMLIDDLKSYSHVVIESVEYKLKQIESYLKFGDEFLYVVVGGSLQTGQNYSLS